MIRLIFVILFVALYLIIGIPILFVEWLVSKKFRYAADISQLRMVQWAFKVILVLSGVHLTVIGEENVPKDTPVLYVGNHRSFFDIIITYARCPRLTGYVAKDSMLKVPLLSLWMKRLYCLFLNRSDVKEGLKTILTGPREGAGSGRRSHRVQRLRELPSTRSAARRRNKPCSARELPSAAAQLLRCS